MALELEYINCCFCGSEESILHEQIKDWKVVRCANCNHIYTNPRPSLDDLSKLYDEAYFDEGNRFSGAYSGENIGFSNMSFYKNIVDVEAWVDKRGKILEVGCAQGDFLKVMQNRGWDVTGIDISEVSIARGIKKNDIELKCGTLESVRVDDKFDAIVMYQCLEHMSDAKSAINKSLELLNAEGVLVIEVPNLNSFDFRISKNRRFWSYDLPFHLSHYTPQFLNNELEKIGFIIVEVDLYYPNFILWAAQLLRKIRPTKLAESAMPKSNSGDISQNQMPLLKRNINWKIKLMNWISVIFPGWRFTVICKKI